MFKKMVNQGSIFWVFSLQIVNLYKSLNFNDSVFDWASLSSSLYFPPESWVDEEQTLNIWWKTSQTVDMVDFLKLATFLLAHPFIYVDKVVS